MLVREKPRLDLDIDIETPSGRHVHWSGMEKDPANVPSGLSFKSTMPGGFSELDVTLPRKRGISYADVERLSTVTVYGPGGDIAWQGRLERAPRSSGSQLSVSPGCVGFQAALEDDQTAQIVYVDRDLSHWQSPSRARQISLLSGGQNRVEGISVTPDATTGLPALTLEIQGAQSDAAFTSVEGWYDGRTTVSSVYYDYVITGGTSTALGFEVSTSDDDVGTNNSASGDLYGSASGTGTFTPGTSRQWVTFHLYNTATWTDENQRVAHVRRLAVFGTTGLTKRGTAPDEGFYPSDVVAHAVLTWAPQLNYTTGSGGSIQTDTFVIPHLAFTEPTTAAEIIRQATRFGLQDWAVWEDRTFYWAPRGTFGRSWRARASEADLQEAGDDTARLFNGVLVQYQDVDGTTKTVGPTGSGADTESTDLEDSDTENPANKLGINRWTKLSMGVSTAAGATEVGRRFLEETKQLDHSGQARFVGHVTDSHGVVHPAWRVRAGDTVSFTDAADSSARRVVSASYDHSSRTCSVDLDAPPDSLSAILERLDVVIAPLGL